MPTTLPLMPMSAREKRETHGERLITFALQLNIVVYINVCSNKQI